MFNFSKDKKETIINPCEDCPKKGFINGCLHEEFVECQTKEMMRRCMELEYGSQYLTGAMIETIENAKNKNEMIKRLFGELSNLIE